MQHHLRSNTERGRSKSTRSTTCEEKASSTASPASITGQVSQKHTAALTSPQELSNLHQTERVEPGSRVRLCIRLMRGRTSSALWQARLTHSDKRSREQTKLKLKPLTWEGAGRTSGRLGAAHGAHRKKSHLLAANRRTCSEDTPPDPRNQDCAAHTQPALPEEFAPRQH